MSCSRGSASSPWRVYYIHIGIYGAKNHAWNNIILCITLENFQGRKSRESKLKCVEWQLCKANTRARSSIYFSICEFARLRWYFLPTIERVILNCRMKLKAVYLLKYEYFTHRSTRIKTPTLPESQQSCTCYTQRPPSTTTCPRYIGLNINAPHGQSGSSSRISTLGSRMSASLNRLCRLSRYGPSSKPLNDDATEHLSPTNRRLL